MAKINVKSSFNTIIVHSSDGKDAALPVSAGQPMSVSIIGGKTSSAHGQVTGTNVVFDNPGQ